MIRNIAKILFVSLLLLTATVVKAEKIITVTDMNVVGDGTTLNTKAIQKAIDFAHAQKGGGCVVFPKGKYLTGTLVMKSNVTLKIEKDAIILGSTNPYDYYALEETKGKDNSALALIVADKVQISLSLVFTWAPAASSRFTSAVWPRSAAFIKRVSPSRSAQFTSCAFAAPPIPKATPAARTERASFFSVVVFMFADFFLLFGFLALPG